MNSTGSVKQPVDFDGKNWAEDCDFEGNDIKLNGEKLRTGRQACENNCKKDEECTHYAYSNWTLGRCFLKRRNVCPSEANVQLPAKDIGTTYCGLILEKLNLN